MLFKLVAGDWSDDGHGKTETLEVEVYGVQNTQDLVKAYELGCERMGIDSLDKFCQEYEQNEFPTNLLKALEKVSQEQGHPYLILDTELLTEDTYYLSPEGYLQAYLILATIGNSRITYSRRSYSTINIGGYGLFY